MSEGGLPNPAGASTSVAVDTQKRSVTKDKWLELLQHRLGTFLLTALITLLTLFSNTLTERIKTALDRAEARQDKFTKLSDDLGMFLFDCELMQKDLAEGSSKQAFKENVAGDFNASITSLRASEYSNRAMITHYWNAETADEFEGIMSDVKGIEPVVRDVNLQLQDEKTDKFTPELASKVSVEIGTRLDPLRAKVSDLLLKMQ